MKETKTGTFTTYCNGQYYAVHEYDMHDLINRAICLDKYIAKYGDEFNLIYEDETEEELDGWKLSKINIDGATSRGGEE